MRSDLLSQAVFMFETAGKAFQGGQHNKRGGSHAILGAQNRRDWVRQHTREAGPFSFGEIVSKDGPDDYKVKIQQGQQQGKTVKKSLTELLGSNDVPWHDRMNIPSHAAQK